MDKKFIALSALLAFQLAGCNSENSISEPTELSYTPSELIEYSCDIEANGIEGCWVSRHCVEGEEFSSRSLLKFDSGSVSVGVSGSYAETCNTIPDITPSVISTQYYFDSTLTSSEGEETDLYQLGESYTLISIKDNVMCFSEGFYIADEYGHDFETIDRDDVSNVINYDNCLERL